MIRKIIALLLFPFMINAQTAFISGDYNLCDNEKQVFIEIGFIGTPPFTFIYAIDNINQSIIQDVNDNPYLLTASNEGVYTITAFNDAVLVGTFDGSAKVVSLPSPVAIINTENDTLSVLNPIIGYKDVSVGNINSRTWIFGDDNSQYLSQTVYHLYLSDSIGLGIPAIYQDSLIVIDDNGCSDTAIHQVWIMDEYWFYIPTSFTPDNDKVNDKFCVEYHAIRENTFLFKVYNAQNNLIFQSTNPQELKCSVNGGWNGTHYKTQKDLPSDTYVYELYFQDFEGWKHKEYGTITLVR